MFFIFIWKIYATTKFATPLGSCLYAFHMDQVSQKYTY